MFSPANLMRDQIVATPQALVTGFDAIERDARLVLPTPLVYRTRHIVLTGSGDSLFAAKAAEMALLAHAGVPVEVRPPLEAGRYHAQHAARRDLENTLVVVLSNSGLAARASEAASLYRAAGATVLAVTGTAEGPLAEVAHHRLVLRVPPLPPAPGFGPYAFAMLALFLLGVRLGEVRMETTMDVAQARRRRLKAHCEDLAAVVAQADAPAAGAAGRLADTRLIEWLGGGPGLAVAEYGAAKVLEASGRHAVARDLEEWAHLNYFDARPEEVGTVLALPPAGRSQGRADELRAYMDKLGRRVELLELPAGIAVEEAWSPLLLSAPAALLAAHLAAGDGAAYGRGGQGRWSDSADASTVRRSAVWSPAGEASA